MITKDDDAIFADWCRDQLPLYDAVVCLDGSTSERTREIATQFKPSVVYLHERDYAIGHKTDHGLRRVVHREITRRFGVDNSQIELTVPVDRIDCTRFPSTSYGRYSARLSKARHCPALLRQEGPVRGGHTSTCQRPRTYCTINASLSLGDRDRDPPVPALGRVRRPLQRRLVTPNRIATGSCGR
jgi:hypothetical protein